MSKIILLVHGSILSINILIYGIFFASLNHNLLLLIKILLEVIILFQLIGEITNWRVRICSYASNALPFIWAFLIFL